MESPDEQQGLLRLDRRRALILGGSAATAAWVAPSILSVPAAAAQTCFTQTLDWQASFGLGNVLNPESVVVGPTTFTISYTFTGALSPVTTSAVDNSFPRTGQPNSYHMQFGASPLFGFGPAVIKLEFSPAVWDLSFTILDIDIASFRVDEVQVTATKGGGAVTGTATQLGTATTQIVANETYRGNAPVPNGSTDGDVRWDFTNQVDTVEVTYSRAGLALSQGIGISNLTYCA